MFGERWYIEVFIIGVILPLTSIAFSLFIPIPFGWSFILILYIVVIVSRIRKKALTVKEAVVLFLISYGISVVSSLFLPDYTYLAVSIPVTFLAVWLIYKSSTENKKLNTHKWNPTTCKVESRRANF